MDMKLRIITTTILLLGLAISAYAAQPMRVSLGLLPFEGEGKVLSYAVPGFISWELEFVPRVDQTSLRGLCWNMQLDQLTRPSNLNDTTSYSKLAKALGVDYLVDGTVVQSNKSKLRIEISIYSASDSTGRAQLTFDSDVESIPITAARIARAIASAVNVPVSQSIRFDKYKTAAKTIQIIDDTLRVLCDSDADISNISGVIRRINREIQGKHSENYALWIGTLYYSSFSQYVDNLESIYKRCPGNTLILSEIIRCHLESGTGNEVLHYASEWKKLDPTSPIAQFVYPAALSRNKQPQISESSSRAWRPMLALMDFRSLVLGIDDAKAKMLALESRNPRSAYILFADGRILSRRRKLPESVEKYKAAIALNPRSFRLKILLAEAYYEDSKDDEAWRILQSIIKKWPNKTECHRLAARMYAKRGDMGKAMEQMQYVEKLDPNGDYDRRLLAGAYMRSGRFIEATRELVRSDPRVKNYMIGFSLVLTVVFLVAVMVIAILVRIALAPDGKKAGLARTSSRK